jgi:hypothetical protein
MAATPFSLEADLQTLIERQPILLSDGTEGMRRYSLVGREIPVADGATSSRWSLDLLYVDERGHLTFVEVKRAKNPELRREVVAQVLEYAANGYTRWTAETLRSWHEATSRTLDADPAARLAGDLGLPESDTDRLWTSAAEKLAAGAMRLIIVADSMPAELQATIEFLNAQMRPAEFLGLELKPFCDGDSRVLAPRWIGKTARAVEQKRPGRLPTAAAVSTEEWLLTHPMPDRFHALLGLMKVIDVTCVPANTRLNLVAAGYTFACIENERFLVSLFGLRKVLEDDSARLRILDHFRNAGFPIRQAISTGEPPVDVPDPADATRWSKFTGVITELVSIVRAEVPPAHDAQRQP